ncbi:ABC transporter permease [Arcanobacterium hippocoleae]
MSAADSPLPQQENSSRNQNGRRNNVKHMEQRSRYTFKKLGEAVKLTNFSIRTKLAILSTILGIYLLAVVIFTFTSMGMQSTAVNYTQKLLSPSLSHLFGTDQLGRDMLAFSLQGMANSLIIGLIATLVSTFLAVIFGLLAAIYGGAVDWGINFLIDLFLSMPHIVLLILISFMFGKGIFGVAAAVALTHWPTLARVVREEVLAVRSSQYVMAARALGKTRFQIAHIHLLPHIIPAALVGAILLFPHAIMHEAAITFLGFGLPREIPAIGNILANAMNYLAMGNWWLALFPGLLLFLAVALIFGVGRKCKNFSIQGAHKNNG